MLRSTIGRVYDLLLRRLLPRKIASFNGVAVRQPRLFDATDVRPEYEAALVEAIKAEVDCGEQVVVVGGGWGVTSVVAARRVGSSGSVVVYEGAAQQADYVRETITLNGVDDRTRVEHAIVGSGKKLYGQPKNASLCEPSNLPVCDTLVLDCEGAEVSILESLIDLPETVLVETHPMYDAPADDVRAVLRERGYEITMERTESTPYGDLPVLTAKREADGCD